MKYEYGDRSRGYSFEHCNFFDSLRSMGHDLLYFDFMTAEKQLGRHRMNKRLVDIADSENPDLMFTVLYRNQLSKRAVRQISERMNTVTVNWFCDDHWRFETFSRFWAHSFNWVVTTESTAMPKYRALGYDHAIQSQWACNHSLYRRLDCPKKYDVSFIGQPHGDRRDVIGGLEDRGIRVHTWGHGWKNGRLSHHEMIERFNETRINLNLPAASTSSKPRLRHRLRAAAQDTALWWRQQKSCRGNVSEAKKPNRDEGNFSDQIKGRNFEVPGCGGFLLTGMADNLGDFYRPGKEIECYRDVDSMARTIRYHLKHEAERQAIADAGYRRTLNEHTYANRFSTIFKRVGLPNKISTSTDGSTSGGIVEEVA